MCWSCWCVLLCPRVRARRYMVASGTHYGDSCCFDYGNAEVRCVAMLPVVWRRRTFIATILPGSNAERAGSVLGVSGGGGVVVAASQCAYTTHMLMTPMVVRLAFGPTPRIT